MRLIYIKHRQNCFPYRNPFCYYHGKGLTVFSLFKKERKRKIFNFPSHLSRINFTGWS
ncbi:hypothetical protein BDV26DRAFT_274317 [Aspergillus bertholletiae]|uniref:Uncharacterized protein n=1 Tax=Aspergillus bertholletiae TaxID=1226010 RepID=A0A5N7AR92_9EURO|nr:hypothetical protein BDV26DRAFT_274317 [Aspergillus bertholletiae]